MAEILLKCYTVFTLLFFALLLGYVNGRINKTDEFLNSRIDEQLKNLKNSSMTYRIEKVEARNDEAVAEQPEEIVAMVEKQGSRIYAALPLCELHKEVVSELSKMKIASITALKDCSFQWWI